LRPGDDALLGRHERRHAFGLRHPRRQVRNRIAVAEHPTRLHLGPHHLDSAQDGPTDALSHGRLVEIGKVTCLELHRGFSLIGSKQPSGLLRSAHALSEQSPLSDLRIELVPCLRDKYAYLVRDEKTDLCAVVDPSEPGPVLTALKSRGWRLTHILNTHHH